MRHRKRNAKLGRKGEHRNAMLANLVCSLIFHRRVTTTLAKAKAARPVAEKMVTLAKKGTLHHRRLAASRLRQEDAARVLFTDIAPVHENRNGGYTRIVRLHRRTGDAAQMAILEWVDEPVASPVTSSPAETSTEPAAPAPTEAAATPADGSVEPSKTEATTDAEAAPETTAEEAPQSETAPEAPSTDEKKKDT